LFIIKNADHQNIYVLGTLGTLISFFSSYMHTVDVRFDQFHWIRVTNFRFFCDT